MREEIEMWWKQALKDLEAAEKNLRIEEFYVTAFLCQQTVEKALKALYIKKLKETPITHSLVYLGRKVGIPEELGGYLKKITPDFVISRYPDATQTTPYELYDEDIARERIDIAKRVVEWVKRELEK